MCTGPPSPAAPRCVGGGRAAAGRPGRGRKWIRAGSVSMGTEGNAPRAAGDARIGRGSILHDPTPGGRVKNVRPGRVDLEARPTAGVARVHRGTRAGHERLLAGLEVKERLRAGRLDVIHQRLRDVSRPPCRPRRPVRCPRAARPGPRPCRQTGRAPAGPPRGSGPPPRRRQFSLKTKRPSFAESRPGSRFIGGLPRKPATKRSSGSSYTLSGTPLWRIAPSWSTARRLPRVSASTGSRVA